MCLVKSLHLLDDFEEIPSRPDQRILGSRRHFGERGFCSMCFWFARSYALSIPAINLWIAAIVQQHNRMLYSRDRLFSCLPQLPLVN